MNTMFLKHLNSGIVLLLLLFSSFINPLVRRWSSNDSGFFFFYVFCQRERKAEPQFQTLRSPFESEPRNLLICPRAKMNKAQMVPQQHNGEPGTHRAPKGCRLFLLSKNVSQQQQRRAFTVRARHQGLANGRRRRRQRVSG